jgi:hypothetical protein
MDHRQLVRILAAGRVLVGAALTIAPGVIGRMWVGDGAASPATKLAFRTMGIRDFALGAGTLHALSTGEPARPWVLLSAISDGVDVAATATAIRRIPLRASIPAIAVAATAATVGAVSVDRLD